MHSSSKLIGKFPKGIQWPQVLVFIFCLQQNIPQLYFQPLYQVFNVGVVLGDSLWYRVMLREGLSPHPCKGYSNTQFPLLLLSRLVFPFPPPDDNPVICSLFSCICF